MPIAVSAIRSEYRMISTGNPAFSKMKASGNERSCIMLMTN